MAERRVETVSSSLTFVYKFFIGAAWLCGFGWGTVVLFVSNSPEAHAVRWQFTGMFLVVSGFVCWVCFRLKRVQLDGTTLVISNYRDEIRVRARDLAEVKQNVFINLRPITLVFRDETPFGKAVVFVPEASFRLFSEDAIVERLRKLARADGGDAD